MKHCFHCLACGCFFDQPPLVLPQSADCENHCIVVPAMLADDWLPLPEEEPAGTVTIGELLGPRLPRSS